MTDNPKHQGSGTPPGLSRDGQLDIGGSPAAHSMRDIARRRVDAERKLDEQLKEAESAGQQEHVEAESAEHQERGE
ncbi:hypothetical protein [Arthrobacter sp. NyZ413]|uniref:hypothetical protein n=1 Tax=Arthrobacter sp. NyZ413 TaxID=3144669 RepID=UPI002CB25095|nr:hypothetical protein [Arthrobacter sp.]